MIYHRMTVRAIDLQPGDHIWDEGTFPRSLYQGTVSSTVIIDAGPDVVGGLVQINFGPPHAGHYTRPEDHWIDIQRPHAEVEA